MDKINSILPQNLTDVEINEIKKILSELKDTGSSSTLQDLYNEDYEEIPVDIETFIKDPYYIGNFSNNGKSIYPYWHTKLDIMFRTNQYQEIALTGCLSGYTKIRLADNSIVPIKYLVDLFNKDINTNEYVVSYDENNNKFVSSKLLDAFSTGVKDVYKILFSNGKYIRATANHKFLLDNGQWQSIDEGLRYNSSLMPYNGMPITIASISSEGQEEVYDLTVENNHNFVLDANVVAHNSIGIGKSTIACIAIAYELYRTMCLKNPQKYYNLASGSIIVFAFLNNTLDLTNSVGYATLQNIVQNSPWFLERGIVTGTKYKEYIPNKLIRFKSGSQASHILGSNTKVCLLDEVNFKNGANVRMEQAKVMEVYTQVLERMSSRFMVNGKIDGKLFIVSSKKSTHDWLESYIEKKKDDPSVMVCDAPLWEVKPQGTYTGETFQLAIGSSNLKSKIVDENDDIDLLIKQGYRFIYPPIEFKERFKLDMDTALMNIAGISISNVTRFITYDNLVKCYIDDVNPFTNGNVLTLGIDDDLTIQDFFNPRLVPPEIYSMPLFVHQDMSLTGDRTGISCVAAMGYKYVNEYNLESGKVVNTKKMLYRHVFTIMIQCPSGSEISLQKNRDFVYYLKNSLGWNIKYISCDGYQSADTLQLFKSMGFENTDLVSLDRKPDGYLSLKSSINDQRISILSIPELETELLELERDNMSGKVDHPIGGCFTGDTEIIIVDNSNIGHSVKLEDITNNYNKYKDYKVLSYDIYNDKYILSNYTNPRVTKKVNKYIEIELDTGDIIKCTHNHPILCEVNNSYKYKKASDLTEEDNIISISDNLYNTVNNLRDLKISYSKICTIIKYAIDNEIEFKWLLKKDIINLIKESSLYEN